MSVAATVAAILALAAAAVAQPPPTPADIVAIQRPFASLTPDVTLQLGKTADWVEITSDAVWVGASGPDAVHRIDPVTNRITATVALPGEACAGMVSGFGALWTPLCGANGGLAQIDLKTGRLVAVWPISPAGPEGGIAASADSLWMTTDAMGHLARIDPATGARIAQLTICPDGYNPVHADGVIWITCNDSNSVMAISAKDGHLLHEIPTGPKPRFLTTDGHDVWTLNQGDGTLTRIDAHSFKAVATIALATPGHGGDIALGAGQVWTTMSGVPLTRISPATNRPDRQWVGPGGDSLRYGFGAIWLTNYHGGFVQRFRLETLTAP